MSDARIDEIRKLLPHGMLPDWVQLGRRMVRLLQDQHHPAAHDAVLNRLLAQARASVARREQRLVNLPRIDYPKDLPITARKDEIVEAIRKNQIVIIAGETGSGKTTQIPKMCLEAGLGIEAMIGCTQPRRVAALSISKRVAEELSVTTGREVGCKIRFDDRSGEATYIKFMTDGVLLAETQNDPLLFEYNALIIDEAHERSLNIDFILGYLKGLLAQRKDLKLIITSATIDTESFSRAFNHAPIIEVSGRLFPVEVIYAPFDLASEERGDLTYIDAAVREAEKILLESNDGDTLIFMPGERDIRETGDLLEGRFGREVEIVPLFGRLSSGDQQRVFAPSNRRKVIIATNIAETSLTIPGIRYVIDTGLARISRYNARTRTRRLPVEPVSQSNANQRKGRSGRVQDGVCIRLYSEEDFDERPPYQPPEIQRSNLAEVILRMKAFRLGEIETFPFLTPPTPAAIQGGYALLQELGALDETRALTPLGRDLARLPIDPTLGRMLLQSQQEHATHELLIIAAGLSIQDPRDRPLAEKDAAEAAHKRFLSPQSDFLTLLNIWNAVHEQWERMPTQNARRRFCRANFLSYMRLREWQDLYAQLHDALERVDNFKLNDSSADYAAIHRSVLTGLLGQVAVRKEKNQYQTAGNRLVTVFPGSALFDRAERRNVSPQNKNAPKPVATKQPQWVVAGEIVETSQLFVRTLAGIDPLWIVEVGAHLCKVTHQNPRWIVTAGNVLVDEKITLHGLEVSLKKVAYGNINPTEATEIFIRAALVEENLLPIQRVAKEGEADDQDDVRIFNRATHKPAKLPPQYSFIEHNRGVRQKIETWQTRVRRHDLVNLDEALFEFYARHLTNVSSVHELNRFLRGDGNTKLLCVTEADLTKGAVELSYDATAFPDAVPLEGQPVALSYAYTPGEEQDGVTVKLGFSLAQTVSQACVEWSVPGLREGQISELLRALPKALRRELMPFPPKIAEIVRDLQPSSDTLQEDLARFIRQRYGVEIPRDAWTADAVPAHLRPRVEVVGPDQKTLGAGRNLNALRQQLEKEKTKVAATPDLNPEWQRLAQQWEKFNVSDWSFGDLPERLTVNSTGPMPVYAWPGLELEGENNVHLKLFRNQQAAQRAGLAGFQRLVSLQLQKDFAWLQKDLRALTKLEALTANFCAVTDLAEQAFENLQRYVLPEALPGGLTEANFRQAVTAARELIPGLAVRLVDQAGYLLKQRQEILRRCGGPAPAAAANNNPRLRALTDLKLLDQVVTEKRPANPWAEELNRLMPPNFLSVTPFEQLNHLSRYLKALQVRMERAALNPAKEQERARQLAPYAEALRQFTEKPPSSAEARQELEKFRWLVEEYKVSLFAQELGTAQPVSSKRLDEQRSKI
jgi:ATP-dependent helicase HrpA